MRDWLDNWFVSLPDNQQNLERAIKSFELGRAVVLISLFGSLGLFIYKTLTTTGPLVNYEVLYAAIVLMLILSLYTDVSIKILKMKRKK